MSSHMQAYIKLAVAAGIMHLPGNLQGHHTRHLWDMYRWLGMDEDGRWWAYRDKPIFDNNAGCYVRMGNHVSTIVAYSDPDEITETLILFNEDEVTT